jgi:glycosyltransferase involved in cell wall biosynthesis
MIVQIFEPFRGGGHFTNYIRALLPQLTDLLHRSLIRRVVVTISQAHRDSSAFTDQLLPFASSVEFESSLPLAGGLTKSPALAKTLFESISRIRPDYLIATTADLLSVGLASRALIAQSLPAKTHSIGIFHYSYGQMAKQSGNRYMSGHLKDELFRFGRKFANWSEVQIVNPLAYERLIRLGADPRRVRLLPHPVDRSLLIDKVAARRQLKIPLDGRYIGSIGASDDRKAIPELLSAFRSATSARSDRVLLAGHLHEPYKALIEREYRDLVSQERLIILNRYLSTDELGAALCASDVAAITYYSGTGLSANLLQAAGARRPVVAGASGYSGMAVQGFELGWSCNVLDHNDLVATIRTALEGSQDYRSGEKRARLIAFHDPKNYAASILGALYERIGLPAPPLKSWAWATSNDQQ